MPDVPETPLGDWSPLEVARNIVNQLFDEADVESARRQEINDRCDVFVVELLRRWVADGLGLDQSQMILPFNRALMSRVLADHQRMESGECACGWGELGWGERGGTFAEHVISVYEAGSPFAEVAEEGRA